MNPKIEVISLTTNKLRNSHDDFIKYDIDISLDEVENNERGTKIKYKISLLSNPTNTKITIEGFASLFGNESDISKQLEPDQRNVPAIVNVIYQEVFPLIYILSKTLQIPCPAYKISQISSVIPQDAKSVDTSTTQTEPLTTNESKPEEEISIEHSEPPLEPTEPVIQEANVSSL